MTDEGDLKACPFCGGRSKLYRARGNWFVRCDSPESCRARMERAPSRDEAMARWNRRTDRAREDRG